MGQKINPTGLRIGVIKNWESRWYSDYNTDSNESEAPMPELSINTTRAKVAKDRQSIKKYGFDYSAIQQFTTTVIQRISKRAVLPRRSSLA